MDVGEETLDFSIWLVGQEDCGWVEIALELSFGSIFT